MFAVNSSYSFLRFSFLPDTDVDVVLYVIYITTFVASIAAVALLYFLFVWIRSKFPVKVACWFCGETSVVLYRSRHCWDCLHCDQYNGFRPDGDYNKRIPAQYDAGLNQPVSCQKNEFISGESVLCEWCTQNQLLKTRQLANFVPYNERNFEEEAEAYERQLEAAYQLCQSCQMSVSRELQIQDDIITKALSKRGLSLHPRGSFREQYRTTDFDANTSEQKSLFLPASRSRRALDVTGFILHLLSLLCAATLLVQKIELHSNLANLHLVLVYLDSLVGTLVYTGLVTSLAAKLVLGRNRWHGVDFVGCVVWTALLMIESGVVRTDHVYKMVAAAVCLCISIFCLLCCRGSRCVAGVHIQRRSLDSTDDSFSISDTSECVTPDSKASKSTGTVLMATGIYTTEHQPVSRNTRDPPSYDSSQHGEDVMAGVDAISLGSCTQSQPRADSGIFSTTWLPNAPTNASVLKVPEALRHRRPLITPARFNVNTSTSAKHRSPSSNKFKWSPSPYGERY